MSAAADQSSDGTSVTKSSVLSSLPDDHPALTQLQELLDEDDDFCSNWKDLYTACELKQGAEEKAASYAGGPTYCILRAWKRRAGSLATLGRLVELLTSIKRLDAVDLITEQLGLKSEEPKKDDSLPLGYASVAGPHDSSSAGLCVLPARTVTLTPNRSLLIPPTTPLKESRTVSFGSGASDGGDHDNMDWSIDEGQEDVGGAGGELVQSSPSGGENTSPSNACSKTKEEYVRMLKLAESTMKPFKCDHCEQLFTYRTGLHSHILRFHPDAAVSLEKDPALGKKDSGFTCNLCGHKFSKALRLEFHLRTHTGERPYRCTTCKKPFARPDHLKAHMAIHVKTKPHVCMHCKRTFVWSSSLVSHIRSIHNPHPSYDGEEGDQKSYYKCHVKGCGKIFAWPSKLKRHIQTHTIEPKSKDLVCTECRRAFTRESSLKAHLAKMHGPGHMLKCNVCERRFSSQAVWESHMKKQHTVTLASDGVITSVTPRREDQISEAEGTSTVDQARALVAEMLQDNSNEVGNHDAISSPVFSTITVTQPQQSLLNSTCHETMPLTHPTSQQLSSQQLSLSLQPITVIPATVRPLPQLVHATAVATSSPGVMRLIPRTSNTVSETVMQQPPMSRDYSQLHGQFTSLPHAP